MTTYSINERLKRIADALDILIEKNEQAIAQLDRIITTKEQRYDNTNH